MKKVFSFGELLLRLSPELNGQWLKNHSMPVFIGGAELNVAVALGLWNMPVSYCSVLPDNELSKDICKELIAKKIDISPIITAGSRIGTYYLPQGHDLKYEGVIYDRAGSSFSALKKGQLDWNELLKDADWFHFSAISPALSLDIADLCKEGLEAASAKGMHISVDLNYRPKLWQYGKRPAEVMPGLVEYCTYIMGNIWSEEEMLGMTFQKKHKYLKEDYINIAETLSKKIIKQYPNCVQVANTFRLEDELRHIRYFATLLSSGEFYTSEEYHTEQFTDKVGTGDCFMAGLIYGNKKNFTFQKIIDFSTAAAFNKLFIKGDTTTSSVDEIEKMISQYE